MNFWLCIASDYQAIHAALCKEDSMLEVLHADKADSNKQLILMIDQLLKHNKLTFDDVSFIGVNLGPGPYTSLRIAIATANGFAFATNLGLVGIDGLRTLLAEYAPNDTYPTTIALLNAFNQELFFGIAERDKEISTGYNNVNLLLQELHESMKEPIRFVGNGVDLYREKINTLFPNADLPDPMPQYASLPWLVKQGWHIWKHEHEKVHSELFPLYLKQLNYTSSIKVK